MSKVDEIRNKILERCGVYKENGYLLFKSAHKGPEDYHVNNNIDLLIDAVSKTMAEEIEKLEKKISKKQTRQLRKKTFPYDAGIRRNFSRG